MNRPSARGSGRDRQRRRGPARAGLIAMVCFAPLWVGGAPPSAVVGTLLAALATTVALWRAAPRKAWRRPSGLWIVGVMLMLTGISLVPLPGAFTLALQPALREPMAHAGVEGWRPLSLAPGATSLELAELSLLAIVFVLGAQFSWRRAAAAVTLAAVAVATVGVVQEATGATTVLGLYAPRLDRTGSGAMFTTFVNPNHQASLFGLGSACAFALGRSLRRRATRSSDGDEAQRKADLGLACLGASGALLAASVFSVSRGAVVAQGVALVLTVVVTLRARWRERETDASAPLQLGRRIGRALAAAAPVALVVAVAAMRGVWRDLATLATDEGAYDKPNAVIDGLAAYDLSPWFGIGRGAFVDAFSHVTTRPTEPIFTHLESIPATMLVEWGPAGVALAVALAGWWIYTFVNDDRTSVRVILLGLLAVALQSLLDFGPDLLGVSVPMVAVAGAIAPRSTRDGRASLRPRSALVGVAVLAVVTATSFAFGRHATFVTRRQVDASIAAGPPPRPSVERRLVAMRPLDAHLHLSLARAHGRADDWKEAGDRAAAARRLDPRHVDAWILEAEALRRTGQARLGQRRMVTGLSRLGAPPSPAFAAHVAARFSSPEELVDALREASPTLRGALPLGRAMLGDHPSHADALASALVELDPLVPEHLELRARARLALDDPELALHFSRLWSQARPTDGRAHVVQAWAHARRVPPEPDQRVAVLEAVVEDASLDDRGAVEEELVRALLARGAPGDLDRARALGLRLLRRPAKASVKRRRRELVDGLGR